MPLAIRLCATRLEARRIRAASDLMPRYLVASAERFLTRDAQRDSFTLTVTGQSVRKWHSSRQLRQPSNSVSLAPIDQEDAVSARLSLTRFSLDPK